MTDRCLRRAIFGLRNEYWYEESLAGIYMKTRNTVRTFRNSLIFAAGKLSQIMCVHLDVLYASTVPPLDTRSSRMVATGVDRNPLMYTTTPRNKLPSGPARQTQNMVGGRLTVDDSQMVNNRRQGSSTGTAVEVYQGTR